MTDDQAAGKNDPVGMSARQAGTLRLVILGVCILSLIFVFQPFYFTLYTIGAGTVVLGGLAFNLIPFCEAGKPLRGVVKSAIIVLIIFAITTGIAIGSAALYAIYLRN
ncbi:MAG: hypothetical protein ACTSX7_18720 [Alphaproteobacteria bacterium]